MPRFLVVSGSFNTPAGIVGAGSEVVMEADIAALHGAALRRLPDPLQAMPTETVEQLTAEVEQLQHQLDELKAHQAPAD